MIFPKLKKNNSKQNIITLLTFFVITTGAGFYFVILPFSAQIIEEKKAIISEKVNLEKQTIRQKNIANLEKTIEQVKSEIKKIENSYINKNNQLEFITTLEGIAARNKVEQKINLSQSNKKDDKAKYIEEPLVLEVRGQHDNVIKYLLDIESLNYYINIKSLEMIAAENTTNNNVLSSALNEQARTNNNMSLRIIATTYWR